MLTGSCLCGAVAYEADAPLERIVHCHCQTCRKTHGAAFSSVTAVPRENFRWIRGARAAGRLRILARQVPPLLHADAARTSWPSAWRSPSCCCDWAASTRRSPTGPQVHIWRSDAAPWYDPKAQFPEKPRGPRHEPAGRFVFLPFHEDERAAQALAGHSAPDAPPSGRSCPTSIASSSRCCPTCSPPRSTRAAGRWPRC